MAKRSFQFLFRNSELPTEELLSKSQHAHSRINIPPGSDLEAQLNMIQLTPADLQVAKTLQPIMEANVEELVDDFYRNLSLSDELLAIVEQHSSLDRLKKTLRQHIIELFSGVIDADFLQKRIRIAHAHVRIGLLPKWYIAAFQNLLAGMIGVVERNVRHPKDVSAAVRVITKLISLEQQLVMEAYDQKAEIVRLEVEQQVKQSLKETIGATANDLAALTEQTNASIEEMTNQMEEISNKTCLGAQLAHDSQRLAEIGKERLDYLQEMMQGVMQFTGQISSAITELKGSSMQIGELVGLIQSIADRTNILALNAAIEAARAGVHGRGFAVVAEEVRKLAEQTKRSVSGVSDIIARIYGQIQDTVRSIEQAEELVQQSNQAMLETKRSFDKILEAMRAVKEQNTQIDGELASFQKILQEIASSSEMVAKSADHLMDATKRML
ncbi:globin-coupled sensor protein [Brevibacillus marinus]|uniref:globin-coupled sensor protein n=1 Tax=Brevibacillus marinus TaxID=2496837 RepID=UPI000F8329E8|nr:globin-coupled sensor protein [Brevibacillus marinus]